MGQVGRIRRQRLQDNCARGRSYQLSWSALLGGFQAGGWRVTEAAEVDVGMHAKKLNGRLCHSSFFPAYMYYSSAYQMVDHPGTKFGFEA